MNPDNDTTEFTDPLQKISGSCNPLLVTLPMLRKKFSTAEIRWLQSSKA